MRVWTLTDEKTNDNVKVLKGHHGNIHAVAFSKDGMLVSTNVGHLIRI